jgi:hypothetical protein
VLRFIPIPQLGAVWPLVRRHIQHANDKLGERNTPEEIYHALRQGMAGLYLAKDDTGIFVVQKVIELDATTTCFVWLAVGPLRDEVQELNRQLEAVARLIGAVRLRMRSPRKGWERATNGYWHVAEMLYEHNLEDSHEHDFVPALDSAMAA